MCLPISQKQHPLHPTHSSWSCHMYPSNFFVHLSINFAWSNWIARCQVTGLFELKSLVYLKCKHWFSSSHCFTWRQVIGYPKGKSMVFNVSNGFHGVGLLSESKFIWFVCSQIPILIKKACIQIIGLPIIK